MIRISDAVREIVYEDAFAREAIQRNLLNLTAYAQEILPLIEEKTKKAVKAGSIVVALARLAHTLYDHPIAPHVEIDSFNVTSNLASVSYTRTQAINRMLTTGQVVDQGNQFFTITQGVHEVTIICSETLVEQVKSHFLEKPLSEMENLVAVSVRFSDHYMTIPNTIYTLVGILAVRHINILEIVSTYTELTFVVHTSELETTLQAIHTYSQK